MDSFRTLTWKRLGDELWLAARRDCIPLTGTFELTPLCNFRCRMCYVRLDPERVAEHGRLHMAEEWVDLARQAKDAGALSITLSGGEPLTHPGFEEIYTELSRMGIMVSLLSNGSLITRRHLELFSEYPPHRIRITLYGASRATYGRLCSAPEGYDRVIDAIGSLRQAGIPLALSFTETSENVGDFEAVLDIAKGLDVPLMVCTDLDRPVRGASSEAESLRVTPQNRRVPRIDDGCPHDVPDDAALRAMRDGMLNGLFGTCRPYRTYFFVTWNGFMENCGSMSFCRSKPFDDGFSAAWTDMHDRLSRLRLPEACEACPDICFCTACPGKRDAEAGRPDAIPSRYCEEARFWRQYGSHGHRGGE